jgi:hypothetical protein
MASHKEEEPEQFKVVDRRPFTSEGERRADVPDSEPEKPAPPEGNTGAGAKQPSTGSTAATGSGASRPFDVSESTRPTSGSGTAAGSATQETAAPLNDLAGETEVGQADAHGPIGPVQFEHLIMSLVSSAMYQLGMAAQAGQPPPRPDLGAAQETIDLLGILQQKTKGNLTPEEEHLLIGGLQELRLAFVEISRRAGRIR